MTKAVFLPLSVHPHARGERSILAPPTVAVIGSSPRPWGTHPVARQDLDLGRFIPTPVGNARFRDQS